jgi:predicted phosphate transport protein (TIGR00153 family)
MAIFNRHTRKIIIKIDDFFDIVEEGLLIFKEGVKNYLRKDMESFASQISRIDKLESRADKLQKSIENDMIIHTILPQHRGEVATLLESIDDLIDTCKEVLTQFDVEIPDIPPAFHQGFTDLTEVVVNACDELIPAARAFFKQPHTVRNQLNKVYFYERESDNLSNKIKKQIFHDTKDLSLAEKSHLRYFTHHIERISDFAESVADMLSSLSMRMVM